MDTIRYYEQNGLMPSPQRIENNELLYNERYQEQLLYIRHNRELGFSLNDIRELLPLAYAPEKLHPVTKEIARKHLETIEDKIVQLEKMKKEFQRILSEPSKR
ncbi:MAG: MerR family DNA-binding protein [Gammaproteobacteria bacterium]|nr:MerR family DNA-binding protein [Gammaproteobacteria bacterium]